MRFCWTYSLRCFESFDWAMINCLEFLLEIAWKFAFCWNMMNLGLAEISRISSYCTSFLYYHWNKKLSFSTIWGIALTFMMAFSNLGRGEDTWGGGESKLFSLMLFCFKAIFCNALWYVIVPPPPPPRGGKWIDLSCWSHGSATCLLWE